MTLILRDDSEIWFADVLENYAEEARQRALSLLNEARLTDKGCLVTDTSAPRKVRFHGRQLAAYRFIHCVLSGTAAGFAEVVRHRCHNRLCINPDHLQIGSRADNKHDDWAFKANGVDHRML